MVAKSDSLYEVAIERFPENALLLNNYSYSLSERNLQLDRALEMSKKANILEPDRPAYLDTIGWIYFKLGKLEEAEFYIRKSIDLQADSPVVLQHLGDVYYEMGDLDNAIEYWNRSLEADPENEELFNKLEAVR
jgi:tetratricopeptide (TPR) repeat protein